MKYPHNLIVTCYLLAITVLPASALPLSDSPADDTQVSLLTYSPGEELYSLFGHSAIRVFNPFKGIDLVYNYGTFSFDQPNFYLKFIKGNLSYSLSVMPFDHVRESVALENRSLIESPLNLTPGEKEQIIDFLNFNARPENKNYLYDFQYDNCSTRILDILDSQVQDSLMLKPDVFPKGTFRQLINPYLQNRRWVHMGIDLLLGMRADRFTEYTEPAFLPDHLHLFIKNFTVNRPGGSVKLAETDKVHIVNYLSSEPSVITPGLIFWILLILMLISVFVDSYFRPLFRITGNLILLLFGCLSLLLLFLWFFPDHQIFAWNPDLLWANPLLLIFFFFRRKMYLAVLRYSAVIVIIIVCVGLLTTVFIKQNTDLTALACMPVVHLISLIKQRPETRS
jgi:hypothetical protein